MHPTRRLLLAGTLAVAVAQPARAEDVDVVPYRGPTPPPRNLEALTLGSQTELRSSSGTLGRVVVVNFFATWCTPCMVEMPALNVLAERGLPWLEVIAIAYGQNEFVLKQAFRARKMSPIGNYSFPILMDADKSLGDAWDIETLPHTFIIGRDGKTRHQVKGLLDWTQDSVASTLQKIADSSSPRAISQ